MTKKQWFKRFHKKLSVLPHEEREAAAQYYRELLSDRVERGETETQVLNSFGSPEQAAVGILCEKDEYSKIAYKSSGGVSLSRVVIMTVLFLCLGLPVIVLIFAIGITAAALAVSGFALAAGGCVQAIWFFVLLCMRGFSAGFLALAGIGVAAAGAGLLLTPLFLICSKWLFKFCWKFFMSTARLICEKKRA